jgi:hypothetical protein
LILNGMALVFMLYVLLNFWKEGVRTSRGSMRPFKLESVYASRPQVFVVTRMPEVNARRAGMGSVVPFPAPKEISDGQTGGTPGGQTRLRKYSTG